MQVISGRMIQIIGTIAEKEHFSFVIDKAVLLYAPSANDLTAQVVRTYNETFVGGGNAAAARKAQAPEKAAEKAEKKK